MQQVRRSGQLKAAIACADKFNRSKDIRTLIMSRYHTHLIVVRLIECNCQCQTNLELPKRAILNWFAGGQRRLEVTHSGKQLQIQRRPKLGQSALPMTAGIMTALPSLGAGIVRSRASNPYQSNARCE